MTRSISVWRPTTGSSLPFGGLLREVAAELVEQLRALRLLARRLPLLAAAGPGEHADDLVADLLGVGVEVEQDARGDAFVLAHEAEQDVLGADVVVAERERLAQRELEHLLRARRERDLAARHLVALADDARHLRAHLLDGDVERLEHARSQAFLLAEEAEQDVLGADVVVLQGTRFVLREDDDLPGTLCEPLEQGPRMVAEGPAAAEPRTQPRTGRYPVWARSALWETTRDDGAHPREDPLPSRCRRRRLCRGGLYSTVRYERKTATNVISTILTSSQSDQFCT